MEATVIQTRMITSQQDKITSWNHIDQCKKKNKNWNLTDQCQYVCLPTFPVLGWQASSNRNLLESMMEAFVGINDGSISQAASLSLPGSGRERS
jgi:hypothetical protein